MGDTPVYRQDDTIVTRGMLDWAPLVPSASAPGWLGKAHHKSPTDNALQPWTASMADLSLFGWKSIPPRTAGTPFRTVFLLTILARATRTTQAAAACCNELPLMIAQASCEQNHPGSTFSLLAAGRSGRTAVTRNDTLPTL
jgi:hypothetical protein